MTKHTSSIDSQLMQYIEVQGQGWVFTPSDFADLGSRTAVASALMRYAATGRIRSLSRGLYDWPRVHAVLGMLWPDVAQVAQAFERKDGLRLQPSGAYAANLLGLSEQVPAKVEYLTDGPTREVLVGPTQIIFKRTTPKNMACAGRLSGLLIQAFRFLGPEHISQPRIAHLRSALPVSERSGVIADLACAPVWMRRWLQEVAQP
ncbi:hypothetical protein C5F52_20080 [Limnohabitans sp. TS-CS-82]|nr:hypothetical protein C5F52_20080 [Limnohabitans sp. TS-CS-82]